MGRPRTPLELRLWRGLIVTPAPAELDRLGRPLIGPCLLWSGAVDRDGYGVIYDTDHLGNRKVHRLAYQLRVGPIEDQVDHLCRIRHCAAPDHLEDVTLKVNIERGDLGLIERSKTACPSSHPYDEENTYVDRRGFRHCRACDREAHRRAWAAA